MKRTKYLLAFILFLTIIAISAHADKLYQTNRTEFYLPDSWHYDTLAGSYAKCYHTQGQELLEMFSVYEKLSAEWPSDPEKLAAVISKDFGQDDYSSWREIEIAGQKTVVVDIWEDGKLNGYMSAVRKGFYRIGILYMFRDGYEDQKAYSNALSTFRIRPNDEIGYFRFGNALVKYDGYRVWNVRNNNYLLVDFIWKNVGNTADMFVVNVDVTAYQDGIELKSGYFFNSEEGTKIMPGKEIKVTQSFTLRSLTGAIEITVEKLLDVLHEWPSWQCSFDLK